MKLPGSLYSYHCSALSFLVLQEFVITVLANSIIESSRRPRWGCSAGGPALMAFTAKRESVRPKVLDFDDNKHNIIEITLVNWALLYILILIRLIMLLKGVIFLV